MPGKAKPGTQKTPADFWFSILILIFVLEFFISVAALCYGLLNTPPRRPGESFRFAFPLAGWVSAMLIAPAAVIGLARLSLSGGARGKDGEMREQAWAERLPERARKVYSLVRGAPLFVVCVALMILAGTILTIDSALSLLQAILLALVPYAPYFIAALTLGAVALIATLAWYRYRMNRLQAEYAYRMQVLERTGVILVDSAEVAVLPEGRGYEVLDVGRNEGQSPPEVRALPHGGGEEP